STNPQKSLEPRQYSAGSDISINTDHYSMDMPLNLRYEIDRQNHRVYKIHSGSVALEDELLVLTRLFTDPEFEIGMDIVCDISDGEIDWTLKDIDKFRSFLNANSGMSVKSKWAVVTSGGVTSHNARLFIKLNESLGSQLIMRVFESREKALEWFAETRQESLLSES
ncbi:MAG: hypothetical protein P1R58_10885, partial [bacterium]|nr:hypothetical protein [bacterium]